MGYLFDSLPLVATAFGIPQYLPQITKLRRTRDPAGVSWSWASLAAVNNAAWFAYFATAGYWTALVPATAATLLAATVAVLLAGLGRAGTWRLTLGEVTCWATYGLYRSDPRLIALGLTGIVASLLMLARIRRRSWACPMTHRPVVGPATGDDQPI